MDVFILKARGDETIYNLGVFSSPHKAMEYLDRLLVIGYSPDMTISLTALVIEIDQFKVDEMRDVK